MRINGSAYVVDLSHAEATTEAGAASTPQGTRPAGAGFDRVEISAAHLSLEHLKQHLAALPDVRADRVAVAREALQDGSYQVESVALAQKMVAALGA